MKFLDTRESLNIIEEEDYEKNSIVLPEDLFDLRMSELNQFLVDLFTSHTKGLEKPILFEIVAPGTEEDLEDMYEMYLISLLEVITKGDRPKKEKRGAAREEIRNSLNLNQMSINNILNYESEVDIFNIRVIDTRNQVFYQMLE